MAVSRHLAPSEMYPAGAENLRAHFVRLASGESVRVVESGPVDGPPIVLVPGWACGAWIFHHSIPVLGAAGFRAIAVELRGHGLSDKPDLPDKYTVHSMRDHLIEILDALALPVTGLIGHSMGASVAAHAAAAVPERVSAIALLAPVGFAGVIGMRLFRALTPPSSIRVLPRVARRRFVIWVMLMIVYRINRPTRRDIDEFHAPTQFPAFTRALRHLLHRYEWKAAFPRLDMPRIVVVGTRDHLSPDRNAGRYAGDIPPLVIEGAGHPVVSEAPGVVNSALIEFFGAHSRRGYISSHDE